MPKSSQIEQILERQAKSWEIRRSIQKKGGRAAREALAHLKEGPWISISRQLGSGAARIAERLSQALAWQVFNREIVSAIAASTHTREAVLAGLEEKPIAPLRDFLSQLAVPGQPSQVAVRTQMMQVVWGLARKGQAIIVGRGANWFLDPRYGLRVRLIAPEDRRTATFAADHAMELRAAERAVRDYDSMQAQFIRECFGRQIDDALGYDLVLNTTGYDVEAAVRVIQTALLEKLHAAG
jgi:cytidylate kinase